MANDMPIVVVEYVWDGADPTIKPLADKLKNYKNKTTIKKTMDGVFDSNANEMNKFLESKGVDNQVMIGANGGACVERSISGALHHEYDVAVISNTVIDFNFDDFQYPYTYNEKYHFGETLEKCKKCSIKQYPDMASYQTATSLNPWAAVVKTSTSGVDSNRKTLEETSPSSGGSIFNAIESFSGGSGSQQ